MPASPITDDEAFVRAIVAAPTDDAPRLVYADWLDERGDPRAAFLRAEAAFACHPTDAGRDELRALRTELDPVWWPRVARPAGPLTVFRCAACGAVLTGPLWPLCDPVWLREDDQIPLVPAGFFWRGDPESWGKGHPCVHLADLRDTRPHPDSSRWQGCCGPDGMNGSNTLCRNGHEIGTECGDCWMPHYLVLDPTTRS